LQLDTSFSPNFLGAEWPLLLEACSFPPDSATISKLFSRLSDPESLFALAEEHGVLAQLAKAIEVDQRAAKHRAFCELLLARRRTQLVSAMVLTAELVRFLEILVQAQVATVVVKGPVLAFRTYGDSSARAYSDVDFVVRHVDIERAAASAIAAGYDSRVPLEAMRRQKVPGQYRFVRPPARVLIELHTERTLRYFPRPMPIEEFFQRKTIAIIDGHSIPALSPEDEFVLISIHGAKHFWERLMWISDIAAMVHNHPQLDWERVHRSSADIGAQRMVNVALLLAERLLRVAVPASMERVVAADSAAAHLVTKIESWLPYARQAPLHVLGRAKFRFQMHGQFFAGAAYLSRLSFSTTEEDWDPTKKAGGPRFTEFLRRPFRLAKRYRGERNR